MITKLFLVGLLLSFTTFAYAQTQDESELLRNGIEFINLGEYDKAISNFEKVLEINPKNTKALNNMAYSHLIQNYYIRAINEYAETLKIDPSNKTALTNLANIEKVISYVKKKGFVEILIHDSENRLVGYLKTDFIRVMADKELDYFIEKNFVKKTITYNNEQHQVFQAENLQSSFKHQTNSTYSDLTTFFMGIAGLSHPTVSFISVIYGPTDQFPVHLSDTITYLYTLFDE